MCDDPTNNDMAYERVRVRNALRVLDNAGIVPSALALTARRMREAREAIDYAADAFMASLGLSFHDGIFAELERQAFDAGPMLLRQRVMARLVERFGGATHAAELSEIESLVGRMAQTPMNANTLGGASISSGERHIRVWREAGRVAEAPLVLEPGERRLWDQRFWYRCQRMHRPEFASVRWEKPVTGTSWGWSDTNCPDHRGRLMLCRHSAPMASYWRCTAGISAGRAAGWPGFMCN